MKRVCITLIVALLIGVAFCSCGNEEIEEIVLSNSDINLSVGDSSYINFTVRPKDASKKRIVWSSSNEKIATVDDGNVKAIGEGTAVITAMNENGIKASCNVKVSGIEITSIVMEDVASSLKVGKTIQLKVKVMPPEASSENLVWSSSDTSIATVDSNGYVKGKKKGDVIIQCTAPNGKNASCNITVTSTKKKSSSKTSSNNSTTVIVLDPSYIGRTYSSEFVFYDSSYRLLSDYEVSGLSKNTIQKAINEIYARNGYNFKDSAIKAYYQATSWYVVNPNFSTSDFNYYERENISLLEKYR